MLRKVKDNWVAIAIITALVLSAYYQKANTDKQITTARKNSVARCIATAPRAAYEIAFQYQAGDARRAAGNIVTARKYVALADAGILTVAAPKGFEGNKALVEVDYVAGVSGKLRAVLTPRARMLQAEGCKEAFSH